MNGGPPQVALEAGFCGFAVFARSALNFKNCRPFRKQMQNPFEVAPVQRDMIHVRNREHVAGVHFVDSREEFDARRDFALRE
ncbi:MAG: hypothetical protein WA268_19990 [Xanthobacteraceae bacterium]